VRFLDLELSSAAGILLACQADEQVKICQGIAEYIQDFYLLSSKIVSL
jgi:hypothetical protein